jgi:integration host factor subunit alpha
MALTKAELVDVIHEQAGVTRNDSAQLLEQVFAIMKETLEKGEPVKISGFGNFVVRENKPRKGRNPQTGLGLTISARRVPHYGQRHAVSTSS